MVLENERKIGSILNQVNIQNRGLEIIDSEISLMLLITITVLVIAALFLNKYMWHYKNILDVLFYLTTNLVL